MTDLFMAEYPQQLTIYRSSAGSGKTFTLVRAYLRMVLPQPHLYRHILAVTFTNKATDEMKARILDKLYELSRADVATLAQIQEYQQIKEELAAHRPDPDAWVPGQARYILRAILGDYGHFSVSTIESFFQKILRAFARELDIPLGYEVEMNQGYVLDRLIEQLAANIDQEEGLHRLLVNYLLQQLEEEKGWEVFRELQSLGHEIFQEAFVGKVKAHVDAEENMLDLADSISKKAWAGRKKIEGIWKSIARQALNIMEDHNLQPQHFNRGTIPNQFIKMLKAEKTEHFDPRGSKTLMEGLENEWKWKTKSKPEYHDAIEAAMDAGMLRCVREWVDIYGQYEAEYHTHLLFTKTASTFGLLGYLERLLNDYRLEHRLLLISDTSRLLTRVIRETDPPFVYEKAGHYYEHFLLDEFQDTSDLQWENFRPLIEESLGYGRFNLLVGDLKQAIYRWRNGNPQLMVKIEEELQGRVDVQKLQANWRTSAGIVHFNNQLFLAASSLVQDSVDITQDTPNIRLLRRFLKTAYEDVVQEPRKMEPYGHVKLELTEKYSRQRAPFVEAGLEWLLTWVQECREAGYAFRDMAILVRKNADGVAAARYLMSNSIDVHGKQESISVSSAESLLLESHPQVRWLLASLRMTLRPEDALCQAEWWDLEGLLSQGVGIQTDFTSLSRRALRIRADLKELRALPLYEAVEALTALLPNGMSSHNAYVLGFLDAVWEYSSREDISISGFMDWWQEERQRKSVQGAETDDAIQILTIHKSKGLEFPVVILPFADWELGLSGKNAIAWVHTAGTVYESDFPVLPVSINKSMSKSDFADVYEEELLLSYLDNLNMLYVALTRPKYRLYLHGDRKKSEDGLDTAGQLLRHIVSDPRLRPTELNGEGDSWVLGQPEPAPKAKEEQVNYQQDDLAMFQSPEEKVEPRVHLRASSWLDHHPAGRESKESGLIIHEALSMIKLADEVADAVEDMSLRGRIKREDKDFYEKLLTELVTEEAAVGWFTSEWDIRTEASILDADGREKRPDRVLVRDNRAIVIDFKTGVESTKHHKQIQVYKALMNDLGYECTEGYLYYTFTRSIVKV